MASMSLPHISPALSLKGEGAVRARREARQVRRAHKAERFIRHGERWAYLVGASLLANEFTGGADAGLVREQELGVPLVPANSRSSRDGRSWRGLRCHVSLSPARSLKGEGAIRARRVALQHDRHECPLSLRNGARSQG